MLMSIWRPRAAAYPPPAGLPPDQNGETMTKPNPFLRFIAIALLGLTAVFTLMGGVGTTCVAFNAEKYDSMLPLVPVKPVFQALVVISIAAALYGIYATVQAVRRRSNAYKAALIFLIVGALSSGVQFYYSLTLRGSTAPNSMRLYLTIFTLAVFLLLRLPPLWKRSGFDVNASGGADNTDAAIGGAALVLGGLLALTTPIWAAPTHTLGGFNYAGIINLPLAAAGLGMILGGAALLWRAKSRRHLIAAKTTS